MSHILNFLGAPEVEKLRRMRKSKSRHRQPIAMLLKMLKDNERFWCPVAQELSRCAGASILWVGHVFLMGLCQASFTGSVQRQHLPRGVEGLP